MRLKSFVFGRFLVLLLIFLPPPELCSSSEWIPVLHCSQVFLSPNSCVRMAQQKSSFFSFQPWQSKKCLFKPRSSRSTPLAGPGTACLQRLLSLAQHGGTLVESVSCGPDESTVCGSLVNTKHSMSSCSNRTHRGEPGPPRCS